MNNNFSIEYRKTIVEPLIRKIRKSLLIGKPIIYYTIDKNDEERYFITNKHLTNDSYNIEIDDFLAPYLQEILSLNKIVSKTEIRERE